MRKFLAALLTAALSVIAVSPASAERALVTVTKSAKWATWGPNGLAGSSDTTNFAGAAAVDTTAAIDIRDLNVAAGGMVTGPGAVTAMNGLKVWLVAEGIADDVDSLYYKIDTSPDGSHWVTTAGGTNAKNGRTGVIAGYDQGNGTAGTTVNNCVSFQIKWDTDDADGAKGAGTGNNTPWMYSPFIRIIIWTDETSTNAFYAARLYVSYTGSREVH